MSDKPGGNTKKMDPGLNLVKSEQIDNSSHQRIREPKEMGREQTISQPSAQKVKIHVGSLIVV